MWSRGCGQILIYIHADLTGLKFEVISTVIGRFPGKLYCSDLFDFEQVSSSIYRIAG